MPPFRTNVRAERTTARGVTVRGCEAPDSSALLGDTPKANPKYGVSVRLELAFERKLVEHSF